MLDRLNWWSQTAYRHGKVPSECHIVCHPACAFARASGGSTVCSNRRGTRPTVRTRCQVNECGSTEGCQLGVFCFFLPLGGDVSELCWFCETRSAVSSLNTRPDLNVLLLPLQVILCLSPMGTSLRVRARRFPGLVQCTTMDWFHPWTREALQSVSYRFLQEIEGIEVWPLEPLSQLPYCFRQLLSLDSCRLFYMILQFVCQGCIQRFSLTAERQQGCHILSSPDHVRL